MNSRKNMLNEDLKSQKLEMYPNMSLFDLMKFARFSPDYDDGMEKCKLSLQFDANDEKLVNFSTNLKQIKDQIKYSLSIVGGANGNKSLKLEYPQQSFGLFMKAMKQKKLNFRPERNGDNISITGDDLTLKNVYLVWKALNANEDPAKVELLKSGEDLKGDDSKDFNDRLQTPKETVQIECVNLGDALALFVMLEEGTTQSFEEVEIRVAANPNLGDETTELKGDALKRFYDAITILENISEQTRFIISLGYNEVVREKKTMSKVLKEFRDFGVAHNIHTYQIRVATQAKKLADAEMKKAQDENSKKPKKEQKSEDELEEEAKGKIKKALESSLKGIMSIKTLDGLKEHLVGKGKSKDDEEAERKLFASKPSPTNPCAKRRMKLFEDLLALGDSPAPKVYWNNEFVVALTYTRKQNHIFGRYKPICVAGSTTEIDPACNNMNARGYDRDLRDHITERDQAGRQRHYVRDGIGNDDCNSESNWCTTGFGHFSGSAWNKQNTASYWNNYNGENHDYPYTIIMEVDSGKLYQYAGGCSSKMFLFENEHISNISKWYRDYTDYAGNMKRFREAYPTLDAMMDKVNREEYKNAGKNNQIKRARDYAERYGLITDNNRIIIRSREDVHNLYPVFSEFDGIIIAKTSAMTNAIGLFSEYAFEDIPPVDCNNVTDASRMFKGTRIVGTLTLKNTSQIKLMTSMFANCRISNIVGLDTSSATDITSMFQNSSSYNLTRFISFPELKLKSCTTANYAFTHCSARKITITSIEKIKSIKDAFINCYALQQMPVLVKKEKDGKLSKALQTINSPFYICSELDMYLKESEVQKIFDGCSTLHQTKDFDEKCKELYEVYFKEHASNSAEEKGKVDERGYLIIQNRQEVIDLANSFHKYPGVYVDMEDATNLFSSGYDKTLPPIRIQVLDMSKVLKATQMFQNATIARLGKIIGLDHVQMASKMFMKCKCNQYPELDFSGLVGQFDVFYDSYASRESRLPKVKVGSNVDFKMPNEPAIRQEYPNFNDNQLAEEINRQATIFAKEILCNSYSYVHDGSGYGAWAATHHELRVATWYLGLGQNAQAAFVEKAKNIEKTKDGYAKFPSKTFFRKYIGFDGQSISNALSGIDGIYIDTIDATGFFEGVCLPEGTSLPPIDIEKVKIADSMFSSFRGKIPVLKNAKSLENAYQMFKNARVDQIPEFETKNLKTTEKMFYSCVTIQPFPESMRDFSKTTNGQDMFYYSTFGNSALPLDEFDFSRLQLGKEMFRAASVKLSKISFPECTSCPYMFAHSNLILQDGVIKSIELPLSTNCTSMFDMSSCDYRRHIKKIGKFYAPRCQVLASTFRYNVSLETIGQLDIYSATNVEQLFKACSSLKCILPIKTRLPRSTTFMGRYMFKDCPLRVVYGNNGEKIRAKNTALLNASLRNI